MKPSIYPYLSIHSVVKRPEIVNVPAKQIAAHGSNVTFNCTATGYPKPNITWGKDNNSGSVKYNLTPNILRGDGNSIFSFGAYYWEMDQISNVSRGTKLNWTFLF